MRDRYSLERIVAALNPASNPRYRWESGKTYCNIFAWDVAVAMDITLPHWVTADGQPARPGAPARELAVHDMMDWLHSSVGRAYGWKTGTLAQAWEYACAGKLALPFWRGRFRGTTLLENGHVAVMLPSSVDSPQIANVGRTSFARGSIRAGFGARHPIEFWLHD
jgi:hypothetical protein